MGKRREPVTDGQPHDELLGALDDLLVVLRESTKRNQRAIRQAEAIHKLHLGGQTYREIFVRDERSLIGQITRENLDQLVQASAKLRWAEVKALHDEGLTMDKIAELFGLTRQRISSLLREGGDVPVGGRRPVGRPPKGIARPN